MRTGKREAQMRANVERETGNASVLVGVGGWVGELVCVCGVCVSVVWCVSVCVVWCVSVCVVCGVVC